MSLLEIYHPWVWGQFSILICSSGSSRFRRLWNACVDGAAAPPVDLRYVKRPLATVHGDSSRARIISYLESIYQSVAENLPDVKELQDASVDGVELALHTPEAVFEDKYTDAINERDLVSVTAPPKSKKDRIRCQIKSVKISEDRRPSQSGLEIRHLPPGHILDYWQQFRTTDPEGGVAFSYFWRELWLVKNLFSKEHSAH